jgi:nitroreductase
MLRATGLRRFQVLGTLFAIAGRGKGFWGRQFAGTGVLLMLRVFSNFEWHSSGKTKDPETMSTATAEQLVKQLKWRYATKKFDPARKIGAEDWQALEEALVLTPSSYGAQPWKFVVVTDQAVKEVLTQHSYGQRQVADCSHHVIFTIYRKINMEHLDRHVLRMAELHGRTAESLAGYRNMVMKNVLETETVNEWAMRQVYLALGNFMTSAAMLGIDTCPMEGFQPEKYDEELGLEAMGLASVVACCAGYRHPDDKYAAMPKVRFKHEDVIVKI